MNSYRAFIDAQEKSKMTEDEKVEKRNSEILMSYRTADDNILKREIPENMDTKSETVNIEPEKIRESINNRNLHNSG